MKAEIKFRAWDEINKEIVYPRNIAFAATTSGNLIDKFDKVMQFAGLLDKNGDEIYSDHLLKDPKGIIFRVYFTKGGFAVKAEYWKSDTKDLVLTDQLILQSLVDSQTQSWIEQCEIIGYVFNQQSAT